MSHSENDLPFSSAWPDLLPDASEPLEPLSPANGTRVCIEAQLDDLRESLRSEHGRAVAAPPAPLSPKLASISTPTKSEDKMCSTAIAMTPSAVNQLTGTSLPTIKCNISESNAVSSVPSSLMFSAATTAVPPASATTNSQMSVSISGADSVPVSAVAMPSASSAALVGVAPRFSAEGRRFIVPFAPLVTSGTLAASCNTSLNTVETSSPFVAQSNAVTAHPIGIRLELTPAAKPTVLVPANCVTSSAIKVGEPGQALPIPTGQGPVITVDVPKLVASTTPLAGSVNSRQIACFPTNVAPTSSTIRPTAGAPVSTAFCGSNPTPLIASGLVNQSLGTSIGPTVITASPVSLAVPTSISATTVITSSSLPSKQNSSPESVVHNAIAGSGTPGAVVLSTSVGCSNTVASGGVATPTSSLVAASNGTPATGTVATPPAAAAVGVGGNAVAGGITLKQNAPVPPTLVSAGPSLVSAPLMLTGLVIPRAPLPSNFISFVDASGNMQLAAVTSPLAIGPTTIQIRPALPSSTAAAHSPSMSATNVPPIPARISVVNASSSSPLVIRPLSPASPPSAFPMTGSSTSISEPIVTAANSAPVSVSSASSPTVVTSSSALRTGVVCVSSIPTTPVSSPASSMPLQPPIFKNTVRAILPNKAPPLFKCFSQQQPFKKITSSGSNVSSNSNVSAILNNANRSSTNTSNSGNKSLATGVAVPLQEKNKFDQSRDSKPKPEIKSFLNNTGKAPLPAEESSLISPVLSLTPESTGSVLTITGLLNPSLPSTLKTTANDVTLSTAVDQSQGSSDANVKQESLKTNVLDDKVIDAKTKILSVASSQGVSQAGELAKTNLFNLVKTESNVVITAPSTAVQDILSQLKKQFPDKKFVINYSSCRATAESLKNFVNKQGLSVLSAASSQFDSANDRSVSNKSAMQTLPGLEANLKEKILPRSFVEDSTRAASLAEKQNKSDSTSVSKIGYKRKRKSPMTKKTRGPPPKVAKKLKQVTRNKKSDLAIVEDRAAPADVVPKTVVTYRSARLRGEKAPDLFNASTGIKKHSEPTDGPATTSNDRVQVKQKRRAVVASDPVISLVERPVPPVKTGRPRGRPRKSLKLAVESKKPTHRHVAREKKQHKLKQQAHDENRPRQPISDDKAKTGELLLEKAHCSDPLKRTESAQGLLSGFISDEIMHYASEIRVGDQYQARLPNLVSNQGVLDKDYPEHADIVFHPEKGLLDSSRPEGCKSSFDYPLYDFVEWSCADKKLFKRYLGTFKTKFGRYLTVFPGKRLVDIIDHYYATHSPPRDYVLPKKSKHYYLVSKSKQIIAPKGVFGIINEKRKVLPNRRFCENPNILLYEDVLLATRRRPETERRQQPPVSATDLKKSNLSSGKISSRKNKGRETVIARSIKSADVATVLAAQSKTGVASDQQLTELSSEDVAASALLKPTLMTAAISDKTVTESIASALSPSEPTEPPVSNNTSTLDGADSQDDAALVCSTSSIVGEDSFSVPTESTTTEENLSESLTYSTQPLCSVKPHVLLKIRSKKSIGDGVEEIVSKECASELLSVDEDLETLNSEIASLKKLFRRNQAALSQMDAEQKRIGKAVEQVATAIGKARIITDEWSNEDRHVFILQKLY